MTGNRNAHVRPGHHPRLAHLHRELERLHSALCAPLWHECWGEHAARLTDLRDKIGPVARITARAQATAADHALVNLLLKGTIRP